MPIGRFRLVTTAQRHINRQHSSNLEALAMIKSSLLWLIPAIALVGLSALFDGGRASAQDATPSTQPSTQPSGSVTVTVNGTDGKPAADVTVTVSARGG